MSRCTRGVIPFVALLILTTLSMQPSLYAQTDGSPTLVPGLNIDPRLGPDFTRQVETCLDAISNAGGIGSRFVAQMRKAPAFIVIRLGSGGVENDTRTRPGGGSVITWNPLNRRPYEDGVPRVPCATLMHELRHSFDIGRGVIGGSHADRSAGDVTEAELLAVRTENWFLWSTGLPQRRQYGPTVLPPRVLWGEPTNLNPTPTRTPVPGVPLPGTPVSPTSPPASPPGIPTSRNPAAGQVILTVVNETPELILVTGPGSRILCGGTNRYFRAEGRPRNCAMPVDVDPSGNPFEVPIVSLVAYFPSGDPSFPLNGSVVWTDDDGTPIDCANAHSENCAIAMGQRGSNGPERTPGAPASRTIRVRYDGDTSTSTVKGRILPKPPARPQ